MKRILAVIVVIAFLSGCTQTQHYLIPPPKTKPDFLVARQDCEDKSGWSGHVPMIGPLIIIFPIYLALLGVQAHNQQEFQKCLEDAGYPCHDGCWDKEDMK